MRSASVYVDSIRAAAVRKRRQNSSLKIVARFCPWEGGLQAIYGMRIKIVVVVLLLAVLGGAADETKKAEDEQTIARNKALSRLNLRKLGLAMQSYESAHKHFFPPPALLNKEGKALLSWRVLILPYLGERELYEQFKLSEPWDSDHNKKLWNKMPNVYAPPDVKTQQPFSTFYQVFVSPQSKKGVPLMPSAFVQGQQARFPNSFPDGVENTILIVEAGKVVPWTKPEDLPFEGGTLPFENGKPLPELGGLFADVFHAVYVNGDVHTLTKKYDKFTLSAAIVANDGLVANFERIEARSASATLRLKNRELEKMLDPERERLRLLGEERDALQKRPEEKHSPDAEAQLKELQEEKARLQKELDEVKKEIEALNDELFRKPKSH
jgi:hypothetical protein